MSTVTIAATASSQNDQEKKILGGPYRTLVYTNIPSIAFFYYSFTFLEFGNDDYNNIYSNDFLVFLVAVLSWIPVRVLCGYEEATAISYLTLLMMFYRKCFNVLLHYDNNNNIDALSEENKESCAAHAYLLWCLFRYYTIDMIQHLISNLGLTTIIMIKVIQGSGLLLGHELLHKPKTYKCWCWMVLSANGYLVYAYEHLCHHKYAGTHKDLSSTTRHTSIYQFVLGRYPIHLRSAYHHIPKVFFASVGIYMAQVLILSWIMGSKKVAIFYVQMTLFHWLFIDAGTYLNHYGVIIGHEKNSNNNTVERSLPDVAWDAPMWSIIKPFSFGIEHHSHHHYGPSHSALNLQDCSKLKYPVALPLAFLLAFIPPLWYRMTDPILHDLHCGGKQTASDTKQELQRQKQL